MSINFGEDREIDTNKVVTEVLTALGLPARQIIDEAQSEANKLRLRQQTETAARRGIFGAPMFFVGDDMFWGNDRLDDALDHCVQALA
ncbi:2-hydroxychromene-2-carboxylate isomerase [Methylibium sp. T29-B]|nr:2-hydroxychromene-2-carboxylate isomerase [Methylibium sp. T29-B]